MKRIIPLTILVFLGILLFSQQISAQKPELEIYFFYSKTCSHCAAEQKFLDDLETKYPQVRIYRYLFDDPENYDLLRALVKKHNAEKYLGLIPMTFIEKDLFIGFDGLVSKKIENSIQRQLKEPGQQNGKINFPIIGKIDISKYSLPVLAVILGILDGFNVCSLGALILILGLVLALRSRKKILIFGGIFILTTAIIYGLLIVLWHQIFSLLASYQRVMTILIGILGIGGGIYFLKEFIKFKKYGPTCEIKTGKSIISKFSSRIQNALKKQESKNVFAIVAIVLLFAVVITVVEFPCSAAVPVVFAGVLAKAQLPAALYLLYLALFLLFYMLDEILVFLIALFTLKLWLTSPKFVTWITLVEAIVLFLLGFYYLIGF